MIFYDPVSAFLAATSAFFLAAYAFFSAASAFFLFIYLGFTAQVLKVCSTPGPTAC